MFSRRWIPALALLTVLVLAVACGAPATESPPEPLPPPEQVAPPPEAPPPEVIAPPPSPEIVHVLWPEEPPQGLLHITDRSSASSADDRTTGGESWNLNIYERPFTAEVMDYRPDLDLIQADLIRGAPWLYLTLWLEGEPPAGSIAWYGVEIDLDVDGRGDWLILARTPPSTEWTTDGVRACTDANDDVGGPTPVRPDAPTQGLDGYETCVFESGQGPDPDAAWARRDPANPQRINLAFKHSLIEADEYFLWGAWADEGVADVSRLDYHDFYPYEQAGSPTIGTDNYPLQDMALVDNTCRWGFGFTPDGSEPGVCYVPPPEPPPGEQVSCCMYGLTAYLCTCPCPGTPGVLPYGPVCVPSLSDRNLKTAIEAVDPQAVLRALAALDISTWQYRSDDASIRHIGPMAQDFYGAFGLGGTDRAIYPVDGDGVAFAAIQGLNQLVQGQDARLTAMETRLENIERQNQLSLADPGVIAGVAAALTLVAGGGFVLGRRKRG